MDIFSFFDVLILHTPSFCINYTVSYFFSFFKYLLQLHTHNLQNNSKLKCFIQKKESYESLLKRLK